MTDEQIIKALECCLKAEHCVEDCPLYNSISCYDALARGVLGLINRQKAEIEQKDVQIGKLCDKLTSYKAEAERSNRDMLLISLELKSAKDEAVKEFADRLKKEFKPEINYGVVANCAIKLFRNTIDYLVKEMTEKE